MSGSVDVRSALAVDSDVRVGFHFFMLESAQLSAGPAVALAEHLQRC
jgi:hypothetical protein